MSISIEYCTTCNYRPMAASLALAIKKETGMGAALEGATRSGAFEVYFEGELIFSKLQTNRFPEHRELVEGLKNRLSL